jgi:hypothetical protein
VACLEINPKALNSALASGCHDFINVIFSESHQLTDLLDVHFLGDMEFSILIGQRHQVNQESNGIIWIGR